MCHTSSDQVIRFIFTEQIMLNTMSEQKYKHKHQQVCDWGEGGIVATPDCGIQGGRKMIFYFLCTRNFKLLIQVNGNYTNDRDFFKGQNIC